jgi:heat shock protein HslJ
MRIIIIVSFMAVFLLSSTDSFYNYQGKSAALTLDANKWWLTTIYQTDGYTQVLSRQAFISFNTPDGKVGGNGSCNSFGGGLFVDGNNLTLGNIFSTKMYCDAVQSIENDFFSRLQKVTRYEINGKKLLLFEGKNLLLEFEGS